MEQLLDILGAISLPLVAVIGVIGVSKYLNGTLGDSTKDVARKAVDLFKQKESIKKIESVEHEQTKIIAEIKDHEEVQPKIRERIQRITNKAADDIEKIKKMDNIKEIDNYIDNRWNDL